MKIALVNVNFRTSGAEQLLGYMTPLPLLLIGGALINRGYKHIQLFDAANRNYGHLYLLLKTISVNNKTFYTLSISNKMVY